MLDSLVRVSRRVGGDADLLAPEIRTARENVLDVRVPSHPRQSRARRAGLKDKPRTSPTATTQD